jgi:hypothetical protein
MTAQVIDFNHLYTQPVSLSTAIAISSCIVLETCFDFRGALHGLLPFGEYSCYVITVKLICTENFQYEKFTNQSDTTT